MAMAAALAICDGPTASCCGPKRLVLCVLVGILLAVVQLLLERLGFLLVGKRQGGQTVLELEGVEEDAVLVVGEGVVYLLVPYDAAVGRLRPSVARTTGGCWCTYRYVYQLEPECVAHQVIRQHHGALEPGVGPSMPVGVGNVQLGDGDGVDLVRRLGHSAFHRLLVLVGENRRHGGVLRGLELGMVRRGRVGGFGGDGLASPAQRGCALRSLTRQHMKELQSHSRLNAT